MTSKIFPIKSSRKSPWWEREGTLICFPPQGCTPLPWRSVDVDSGGRKHVRRRGNEVVAGMGEVWQHRGGGRAGGKIRLEPAAQQESDIHHS